MKEQEGSQQEILEQTPQEIVTELVSCLGEDLVTLMTIDDPKRIKEEGEESFRDVRSWVAGDEVPLPDIMKRITLANDYVKAILPYDSPETIKAFFIGKNPVLYDRAAILVMRENPEKVAGAVKEFIANG